MGDAKRRKLAKSATTVAPGSSVSTMEVKPPESPFAPLMGNLTADELRDFAKKHVPKGLATYLFVLNDSEQVIPPANGVFPKRWPYEMRCLEASPVAMAWISNVFRSLNEKDQTPTAYTNIIKILAIAVNSVEVEAYG
jgi:hypothetical protein